MAVEAFRKEVQLGAGHSAVLDAAIGCVDDVVRYAAEPGAAVGARTVVEHLAVTLQASLLVRFAPTEISEAFVASRLGGAHRATFGTLEAGLAASSARAVVDRAWAG